MSDLSSELPSGAVSLRCVVDASVAIKLFVEDELSERADDLFSLLAADPPAELHVPDLFYIECTNILWKYVRWAGMTPDTAHANLADLGRLMLFNTPTMELMDKALGIAIERSITAYDACYVALAEQLDVPLITGDEKLANTVPSARWLGAFELR